MIETWEDSAQLGFQMIFRFLREIRLLKEYNSESI
jgi:hypothetical protein